MRNSIPGCAYLPDAMYDLSRSYFNDNKYDSCLLIGKELLDYAEPRNLSRFLRLQYILNGYVSFSNKEYLKAIDYFTKSNSVSSKGLDKNAIIHLGQSYLGIDDLANAKKWEKELISNGNDTTWLSYCISVKENNYKQAAAILWQQMESADKIYYEWITQSQEKDLLDKYKLLAEITQLKTDSINKNIIMWITIGVIVIILLTSIIIYLSHAEKDKECKLDEKIAIINRLESQLELNKNKIDQSVKDQFNLLNKLVGKYYIYEDENIKRSKIYKEIKNVILSIQTNKDVYKNLEKTVNEKLNNLMHDFLQDFPNLQPWEPSLFLFTVLGFSSNSISVFQEISPDTINNRKTALRKKIIKSGKTSSKRYLKYLGGKNINL